MTREQIDKDMDTVASWVPRHWTGAEMESASKEDLAVVNRLRSYLAQQPTEDVVRKAHEALRLLHEFGEAAEGIGRAVVANKTMHLADDYRDAIRSALPPLQEETP